MRTRRRAATRTAPTVLVGLAGLVGVLGLLAGCTSDPVPATPGTTTGTATGTPTASPTDPPEPDAPTPSPGPFDCDAVGAAQQSLTDATDTELERLAVGRGDPRAFTITTIVATREAPTYWRAVADAVLEDPAPTEGQRGDLALVTAHWDALAPELATVTLDDGAEQAVQAAAARLAAVTDEHLDALVPPAQQRLQDLLAGTCGLQPGPSPTTLT